MHAEVLHLGSVPLAFDCSAQPGCRYDTKTDKYCNVQVDHHEHFPSSSHASSYLIYSYNSLCLPGLPCLGNQL
jgi:hypothetical protein